MMTISPDVVTPRRPAAHSLRWRVAGCALAIWMVWCAGQSTQAVGETAAPVETMTKRGIDPRFGGITQPLTDSARDETFTGAGNDAVIVSSGLAVELVSDRLIAPADMMVLLPDDRHPTHAIATVEFFRGSTSYPSVQRINLKTGAVEVVLRGLRAADPIKRTPWGTVLVGEEAGRQGRAYEILDPLHTADVTVRDRQRGIVSDQTRVAQRPALGSHSWESLVILNDGTVYMGDERRSSIGRAGGAITKFVPARPWTPGAEPITDLSHSPLTQGKVYALRLEVKPNTGDFAQGTELGYGRWIPINGSRSSADDVRATGFYRPEDMELDPLALADGVVRVCWANTGREQARLFGSVNCLVDTPTADRSYPSGMRPDVQLFVDGHPALASPDNLAFQPKSGILYILEDGSNDPPFRDDVWACLRDGPDTDMLSDGCIRVLSLRDPKSELSGLVFTADGTTAYLHLMHRDQTGRTPPDSDDYPNGSDDLLKITGF